MRLSQNRWLHYAFVVIAIAGSLVSLFALFVLASPSWTIPVNMLSIICILLAMKTRNRSGNGNDG
jgi:hypothetical protein